MGRSSKGPRSGLFRRALFWVHLGCGITAGGVILVMSVTGVLLTYERQVLAWAEASASSAPPLGAERLPLDRLVHAAPVPAQRFDAVAVSASPGAPVLLRAGRRERVWLDPFTGGQLEDPAPGLRRFFATVTAWHRWFAMGGESRDAARAITGASNLVFLFLAASGLVLWFPRFRAWAWVRGRIWFRRRYATAKARDYNWHHVLGFWFALPLVVITATGSVFYYRWASDLVYLAAGDRPPARSGPGRARERAGTSGTQSSSESLLPLQALLDAAAAEADGWNTLTVSLPAPGDATVSVRVDRGNGAQPHRVETLELDRRSGAVAARETFQDRPAGARARSIVRFLHTGEVLGPLGQTVAGLASLAGAVLVWTGLALACRRLILPALRRFRGGESSPSGIDPPHEPPHAPR